MNTDKENRLRLSLANAAVELNEARVAAASDNSTFAALGRLLTAIRRLQAKVQKREAKTNQ